MFERINRFIRDCRIKADFPRYEKICRLEHAREAAALFSTRQLEADLQATVARINHETQACFGEVLRQAEARYGNTQALIQIQNNLLRFFVRDYKAEIDQLYAQNGVLAAEKAQLFKQKDALKPLLAAAYSDKDDAWEALNSAKAKIDSWHNKADRTPWLLGNGGKKLPKHSLFGQSFGDLDAYKHQRSVASDELSDCKQEIQNLAQQRSALDQRIQAIKQQSATCFEKITDAKTARKHKFALQQQGQSRSAIEAEIASLQVVYNCELQKLSTLTAERSDFIASKQSEYGTLELQGRISRIEKDRDVFIRSFDLPDKRIRRTQDHRHAWLQERNFAAG